MDCRELEPLLQPYVDGEFAPDDAWELEQHLAGCGACDARVREERLERAALRRRLRESQVPAPPRVREAVLAGLQRERRRAATAQLTRWGSVTLAVAAASTAAWSFRPSSEEQLREEAALRHARRLPIEVQSASTASVEAWFDGKLNHPVHLPHLTNATLAGARLSHVSDRDAAYVTYTAASPGGPEHRIGVFVIDDGSRPSRSPGAMQVTPAHGYNVATWQDEGLTYQLVTDLDESEIRKMVGTPTPAPYAIQPASFGNQ